MLTNSAFRAAAVATVMGVTALAPIARLDAQVSIKRSPSGFNVFSVQQDVEVGRQSAAEVERQLPILNDSRTNNFLGGIVARLAAQAPGAKYPYSIKAVNATEINAFALPGGPMYVNRGLITMSRNEAELAGVLAHEMSHVILRHGTEQASKAYLGKAGLSILGGLLGKSGSTSQMVNAVGGFGLNAAFLKFSRSDELEADALGAELMAKAGYDPVAMATMFAMLRSEQGRDPGKVERFFSSHPPSEERESRIRALAPQLGGGGRVQVVGGLPAVQQRLGGIAASTTQPQYNTSTGQVDIPRTGSVTVTVPAPSTRYVRYTHSNSFFTIDYPSNWRAFPSGNAVSLAPDGGVVEVTSGQPNLLYGAIVNHYHPFEGETERWNQSMQRNYTPFEDRTQPPRAFLEDATDDLVRQLQVSNSYLAAVTGSARAETIDGARAYSVLLNGRSPVTGEDERAILYTRGLPDRHVIYVLCVAPAREAATMEQACSRMVRTMTINDGAAHPPN